LIINRLRSYTNEDFFGEPPASLLRSFGGRRAIRSSPIFWQPSASSGSQKNGASAAIPLAALRLYKRNKTTQRKVDNSHLDNLTAQLDKATKNIDESAAKHKKFTN
jgi:hypothetical protein